jgi:hypothetical protein
MLQIDLWHISNALDDDVYSGFEIYVVNTCTDETINETIRAFRSLVTDEKRTFYFYFNCYSRMRLDYCALHQ